MCSGTVVAVGREPFRPAIYSLQKSPAPTRWRTNRRGFRRQKVLNCKFKENVCKCKHQCYFMQFMRAFYLMKTCVGLMDLCGYGTCDVSAITYLLSKDKAWESAEVIIRNTADDLHANSTGLHANVPEEQSFIHSNFSLFLSPCMLHLDSCQLS